MEIFPVASLEKIEESNQMLNCSIYLFLILFLIYNNDFQDVVSRETSYALQPVARVFEHFCHGFGSKCLYAYDPEPFC